MAAQRGERRQALKELLRPAPEIELRASLRANPSHDLLAAFFVTTAAERALAIFSEHLARGRGGAFSIIAPPGSGKTHFLNLISALYQRTQTPESSEVRRLCIRFQLADGCDQSEFERELLERLARGLGNIRASSLWRRMGGTAALGVAISEAARTNGSRSWSG